MKPFAWVLNKLNLLIEMSSATCIVNLCGFWNQIKI